MFAALLSFPSGRLTSRVERTVVGGFALASAIVWTLIVLVVKMLPAAGVLTDCGKECPETPSASSTHPHRCREPRPWR